ncbi:MAG: Crp/Fnr family transcriptional regulator [Clostridia bacterium]|nr:Crp/Fnr family transcriptional regulator [Clostridia bacterium]
MTELTGLPLFAGMDEKTVAEQMTALRGQKAQISKGSVLIREGEKTERCGILLSGQLQGQQINEDGALSVITTLSAGMMFGEILIFSDHPAPVTLTAVTDCRVLWLGPVDLARADARLIRNLLSIIGKEYWALHQKIRYCAIVSLRKRIYAYLSDREKEAGKEFTLPFDRNGMAAYLNADRSALSRELSRMKTDGILEYHKNQFRLTGKGL